MEPSYVLVRKSDLLDVGLVTYEERLAIRAVVEGSEDADLQVVALSVLRRARSQGLWLGCDCRREGERRPVVAPWRSPLGNDYWRVLGKRQLAHDDSCVFYRAEAKRAYEEESKREARRAPRGYFEVLQEEPEKRGLAGGEGKSGGRGGRASGRPALSRQLARVVEAAGLTRVCSSRGLEHGREWAGALREATKRLEVAPGRSLHTVWFPFGTDWQRRRVQARLRDAESGWPAGKRVQGFLCWVVWDVEDDAVGVVGQWDRVEVAKKVRRLTVGRHAVPGPYLFIGVVGRVRGGRGFECLDGYVQPIVARGCPVPVDSDYERRAFGTLRGNVRRLARDFPSVEFELEKPVFDIVCDGDGCLPDFLIRARRRSEEVVVVVEVMGFDRPAYLQGKEVTHPLIGVTPVSWTHLGFRHQS